MAEDGVKCLVYMLRKRRRRRRSITAQESRRSSQTGMGVSFNRCILGGCTMVNVEAELRKN